MDELITLTQLAGEKSWASSRDRLCAVSALRSLTHSSHCASFISYLDYRASPSSLTFVPDSRVLSICARHMFWGRTFWRNAVFSGVGHVDAWQTSAEWHLVVSSFETPQSLVSLSPVVKPCIHRPRNAFDARRMSSQYLHFRLFKVVVLKEIRRRRKKSRLIG